MTKQLENRFNGRQKGEALMDGDMTDLKHSADTFERKKSGAYHLMRYKQKEREIDEYRLLYQVRGHHLIPYAEMKVVRYGGKTE